MCPELLRVTRVPHPAETVRASKRDINKGVRDLDRYGVRSHSSALCGALHPPRVRPTHRELLALKREEAKLIAEIKAAAKANNTAATRVLAKSLVRLRSQMAKLQGSQANLRGVSTNLTTAAAATTVAASMGTATAAMSSMQQQMNPAQVCAGVGVGGRGRYLHCKATDLVVWGLIGLRGVAPLDWLSQ